VNVDWVHVDQGRFKMSSCEHSNELLGSIQGGEFLD
jgi:hypothetical protein